MPQSHTWQPLSMCRQNSVRGRPENSLRQERTHAEWFSHSKCFFVTHKVQGVLRVKILPLLLYRSVPQICPLAHKPPLIFAQSLAEVILSCA